jgi:hypothetical protein
MFAIGFPGEHQGHEEVVAEQVTDDFDEAVDNLIDALEVGKTNRLWYGAALMVLVLQSDGTTRWEVLGGKKETQ